ncbi:MAG: hypothetical protein JWN53_976 [Gemmatimonadetes bacterium]|nr:hypothetical protein [Gemmatimonadota bacterium]
MRSRFVAALSAALALGSARVGAQQPIQLAARLESDTAARAMPFHTGEQLTYLVKFGKIRVGTARMSVVGVEDVRGRPSYHLVFTIDGGIPLLHVNDRYESWIDTVTLASRRHVQEIREARYHRSTRYEIYPEEQQYRENDEDSLHASVASPLDEGSFVYFIRTVRIAVGETRAFRQYFKPDRNPVVIRALRRDTVEVPSGRYPTVVVRPTIPARGLFAEGGEAELWFTDDSRRMLVQLKTKFAGFSLSLALTHAFLGNQ